MAGGVWRRRRSPGRGGLRFILLACVSGLAGWSLMYDPPKPQHLKLVEVQKRSVPVWASGLGHVQASRSVVVQPLVEGQLKEVLFQEGQQVKKGDVLARIDPLYYQAQLEQARANKAQDEAQLAAAQDELKKLVRAGKQYKADRQSALRATIRQFEAAIKSDQAAITAANMALQNTSVTAPIDGRVGLRRVDEGNVVRPGDGQGLVEITQMQPVNVMVTMGEQFSPQLIQRMAAGEPLAIQALDLNGQPLAEGTLTRAENQVSNADGAVHLKAVFDNADHALWPGGVVSTRIKLAELDQATVIPSAALLVSGQQHYVYVADVGKRKLDLRPVTIVHRTDEEAVIETGLQPGEQVAIHTATHMASDNTLTTAQAHP